MSFRQPLFKKRVGRKECVSPTASAVFRCLKNIACLQGKGACQVQPRKIAFAVWERVISVPFGMYQCITAPGWHFGA